MKIICSCGTEFPSFDIKNVENMVFERDKYQRVVFPGLECSKCGRRYRLVIALEPVGTNPYTETLREDFGLPELFENGVNVDMNERV